MSGPETSSAGHAVGDRLGNRYRLISWLGAGGMAVVWRAYDEVLNRQVAVKVLAGDPAVGVDTAQREQIRAEALAVARLSHPHITNVFDYGEAAGMPYVVMELLDGQTLAERHADGPLTWRGAAQIGAEVAAALATAHAHGVVHRDIKPANVMLTNSGAKVLDFGIAGLVGTVEDLDPDAPMLGTPGYLAPERLTGQPLTAATDVYGLGMLLYRSVAGRLPWSAETVTQMIEAQVLVDPAPLSVVGGMPPVMANLIDRCLARDPSHRPDSVEVAQVLAGLAGIKVVLPRAAAAGAVRRSAPGPRTVPPRAGAGRTPRRRRMLARIGAAGVVVAVAAALALLVYNGRGDDAKGVDGAAAGRGGAAGPGATGSRAQDACWVDVVTKVDTGGAFTTRLTVVNSGQSPWQDWALTFAFDGAERVTAADGAQVSQAGAEVRLASKVDLPAGKAITIGVSGTGARAGQVAPSGIRVDAIRCVAQVRQLVRPEEPLPPVTGVTDPPRGAPVGGPPGGNPTAGPSTNPAPGTVDPTDAGTPPPGSTTSPPGPTPVDPPTPSKTKRPRPSNCPPPPGQGPPGCEP